ncbi:MAG: hypothetical protein CMG63_00290 [Candidatus Marinimicrobia bacterium]|nr:hypothetical protein [Candidatus Neomarinimicrobiota bacterium]
MEFFKKSFCLLSLFIFSLVFAQNEESNKDTVIIDGTKYARIVDEQYFDDLDYDEGMWRLAPGYGFGVIKGSKFSTIPSGYSINVITPYGFEIGPFYYNISFAFGEYKAKYREIIVDEIGVTIGDTLISLNPFYIGIGGDLNFFESLYSEGHLGIIGSGFGFRGFLGFDTGNLGDVLSNDLDVNIMIGSEFYISTEIVGSPSYWATLSLRFIYSFHTLFGS